MYDSLPGENVYLPRLCESMSSNGFTPFFPSATLFGCLVCVICNSKSFHFFIFKLCIMIVHILIEDVHQLFCAHFMNIFSILWDETYFRLKCLDGDWFVICNSTTVHYYIFKLFKTIVHT